MQTLANLSRVLSAQRTKRLQLVMTNPTRDDIDQLQACVDTMIRAVGGYWPPLAASTRLLEEVGEINDLFLQNKNGEQLREELSDVLIISTCLANQYCIRLWDWVADYTSPEKITRLEYQSKRLTGEWIGHLSVIAGNIGRLVNAYEGVKTPKAREHLKPLGYWIAALHGHLLKLAAKQSVDLFHIVADVAERKSRRDLNRFRTSFDPSTASCLDSFAIIRESTKCPFARAAKLWGAPGWEVGLDIRDYVDQLIPLMTRFTHLLHWEVIDGLVVEIKNPDLFSDLKTLSATFRSILVGLNQRDPVQAKIFEREVRSEHWQFEFNGIRMFPIVFSPIYGSDSPRETYGAKSTFLFFQPEISFKELKIPRDSNRETTRAEIRQRFALADKPYRSAIIDQPYEAPRYIKPLLLDDEEVQWWIVGSD